MGLTSRRTLRVLASAGIAAGLLILSTVLPVSAIPTCPPPGGFTFGGLLPPTLADYIAFGSGGCQFSGLTFSNFSYDRGATVPFASDIHVIPQFHSLRLSAPLFPWDELSFQLSFQVAGSSIRGNEL